MTTASAPPGPRSISIFTSILNFRGEGGVQLSQQLTNRDQGQGQESASTHTQTHTGGVTAKQGQKTQGDGDGATGYARRTTRCVSSCVFALPILCYAAKVEPNFFSRVDLLR